MATLYDDADGVRHAVTPKFLDSPLGVRFSLSGNFRTDGGPTPPPPPPPPPPPTSEGSRGIGWYPSSRVNDAGTRSLFGQDPMAWSSYWQPGNYASLSSVERDRMSRGCDSVHLYAGIKDTSPGSTTEARDNVLAMIAGNPPAKIVDYLTRSENVAKDFPDNTMTVHPSGELEVGYNQTQSARASGNLANASMNSLFVYYNDNETQILTAIGKYVNAFFDLCDEIAPSCLRAMWMGGSTSGTNNAKRNTIFSQVTNPPSFVTADPYQNSHVSATTTAQNTWASAVNLYRSPTGAHNSHYLRWGQPPISFNEVGISHDVNTDAEQARWIGTMYEGMVALDIARVIYFNSSGPQGTQFISGGSFPQSVAAFSGEITQAKQAAASA